MGNYRRVISRCCLHFCSPLLCIVLCLVSSSELTWVTGSDGEMWQMRSSEGHSGRIQEVRECPKRKSRMEGRVMTTPPKPLWIKYMLTRLGEKMSPVASARLNDVVNYLQVGSWMRQQGYNIHRVQRKEQLFDLIAQRVGNKRVLYMELGVWQGDTMRYWSSLLTNPESRLHGFDSFEGLPEDWDLKWPKGMFSTDGKIPQIDDPRVTFFKGWFQDTLADYEPPPHDVLVINFDADLYSSTIYGLNRLKDAIVPGTYLYFDEFHDGRHEFRAFTEFRQDTGMRFELVGVTPAMQNVVFQRLAEQG